MVKEGVTMLNALKTRTNNSLFIHRFWDKIAPRVERDHRSNVLVLTGRAMLRLYFHYQSYPQLGIVFALAPSLHSFWSYFSTDLQ